MCESVYREEITGGSFDGPCLYTRLDRFRSARSSGANLSGATAFPTFTLTNPYKKQTGLRSGGILHEEEGLLALG